MSPPGLGNEHWEEWKDAWCLIQRSPEVIQKHCGSAMLMFPEAAMVLEPCYTKEVTENRMLSTPAQFLEAAGQLHLPY